jgi:UDP-N-acetylmuramoylalanine--D-glutamate ligase
MLPEWRARGGEIAVVGLGRSGVSAARLLRARGLAVYVSDTGTSDAHQRWASAARAAGADVMLGGHDLARVGAASAVVVAPGVPPDAPPLAHARTSGREIVAEAELGLSELPQTQYVAITGTNGKTTTTSLAARALAHAGLDVQPAGNIGVPVCDVALAERAPAWLALELSSFQLHDMPQVRPAVGVITNLAPNHLDRYASLAEYYGDKMLLLRNAGADSVTVLNGDDEPLLALAANVPGRVLRFSLRRRADAWFDRLGGQLMLDDRAILARDDLPLLGDHNVANALTVFLVAEALGVDLDAVAGGMASFEAIPHRVEPIREVGGVLWINDSKSTNITSTEVALAAIDRPYVLLLGGRHKGEPYSRLAPLLRDRCRAVVAYGEARSIIEQDLAGQVRLIGADTFSDVIAVARREAQPGDAVLLSPACSSYDMFNNYEERGAAFRQLVEEM